MFTPATPTARRIGLKRSAPIAMSVLLAVGVLAGCSSSHHSAGGNSAPDTIVISNFAFQPSTLVVTPGATVTVRNDDTTTHTVTASAGKAFDTGNIAAGTTANFTAPSEPGSYPYICEIHQFMHGTLKVR